MNRLFKKKFITSIIFIIFLMTFSVMNFINSYKVIVQSVNEDIKYSEKINLESIFTNIEEAVNENLSNKYNFIELYGYLQKLMGKNEINNFDVIKDEEGVLCYSYFADKPKDVSNLVKTTFNFKNNINDKSSKIIYIMTPDKYIKGKSVFETGLPYNFANETADNFLEGLNKENIDYIDLRTSFLENDKSVKELFYITDHHWRVESAFDAYCEIIDILNKRFDEDLDSSGYFTDSDNYNFETYKKCYLGSMGRKVGKYYGSIDDFTLIYPKFKTNYSFYSKTDDVEITREGRFEKALINTYSLNYDKDEYDINADKYFSYLLGNQAFVHIKNNDVVNGKRVVFIKDSYAVPVAAFMSSIVSDVYLIDPRYYSESILDKVNELNSDYIFISFYPQDLSEEFFSFDK